MPAKLPWLIGRDFEDSHVLSERLRALGHPAEAFPCISRKKLPFVWPEAKPPISLLITSVFGARCLLGLWPECLQRWPGVSVVALAPKTSAWLRARGVPVAVEIFGGARQLAEEMAARLCTQNPRSELVWLSSDAGAAREEQAKALHKLRPLTTVHRVLAYSTATAPSLGQQMEKWHGRRAGMLFCSPSACDAFLETRRALQKGPLLEKVACVGASTLRAWENGKEAKEPLPTLWKHIEAFVEGTFPETSLQAPALTPPVVQPPEGSENR